MRIRLEYTPRCPHNGVPFTEERLERTGVDFETDTAEIALALVDLWDIGWPGGPVGETLGEELSTERGVSHARRKREIIETVIAPTVDRCRDVGVQVFHCTHRQFLEPYPQWIASTTEAERHPPDEEASAPSDEPRPGDGDMWPPKEWVATWREQHRHAVWRMRDWGQTQSHEVYPGIGIPAPVHPRGADLLAFDAAQFHRLLSERRIRVLFYMGFESTECLQFSACGMAQMQPRGYMCVAVRDATTTYEVAETHAGLWRSRCAIVDIEARWGYSVASSALRKAIL
jgi:nicotinamidase-related amidase